MSFLKNKTNYDVLSNHFIDYPRMISRAIRVKKALPELYGLVFVRRISKVKYTYLFATLNCVDLYYSLYPYL